MNIKSRALIIKDNNLLLIYRLKNGREYYTFTGGKLEDGETLEEGALREVKEETSLDIELGKELFTIENDYKEPAIEHYFLVNSFNGELKLGGPEAECQSENNFYRLEWVPIKRLKEINLLPEIAKNKILEIL